MICGLTNRSPRLALSGLNTPFLQTIRRRCSRCIRYGPSYLFGPVFEKRVFKKSHPRVSAAVASCYRCVSALTKYPCNQITSPELSSLESPVGSVPLALIVQAFLVGLIMCSL